MKRFIYYSFNEKFIQDIDVFISFEKVDTVTKKVLTVKFIRQEKERRIIDYFYQTPLVPSDLFLEKITPRRYYKIIRELLIIKHKEN